jgi:hypothetical protein
VLRAVRVRVVDEAKLHFRVDGTEAAHLTLWTDASLIHGVSMLNKAMSVLAIGLGLAFPAFAQEDPDTPAYPPQDTDVDVDVDADLDDADADVDVDVTPEATPPPRATTPAPAPRVQRTTVMVDDDEDDRQNDNDFMQLNIGAGSGRFISDIGNAATGPEANWNLRALFGADSVVGLEAAYVGSAQSISGLGLEDNNLLLSNGVEGDVRLAPRIDAGSVEVTPFGFAGLGYGYYNIVGEDVSATASVEEDDHIMTLPAGVGLEVGLGPVDLEGRFTYRHAFDSDLFGESNGFDERSLSTWNLGAGIGFEF